MEFLLSQVWPLIIAGGFTVGLLVGMTGVGAGSLTTPFLITVIGVNPILAVGTDLLFACITKSTAAWRHYTLGNVNTRTVLWLAAGSLPAAASVFLFLHLSGVDSAVMGRYVRTLLSISLAISAVAIAVYPLAAASRRLASPGVMSDGSETDSHPIATLILGVVLGAAVAMTSVGAGAIGVVALTALYPHLPIRRLVGTDIVHAIPLTLVAGLAHLSLGNVDLKLLATLLIGSVPGIAIGSRLTGKLPDWALRTTLASMLCLAAVAVGSK